LYWNRLSAWLNNDELAASGLAAFANGVRNDDSAIKMLQPPSGLASALVTMVKPSTSKQTQHVCVCLMRNLCIPEANVPLVGQPVLDAVVIKPFDSSNDHLPMQEVQCQAYTLHIIRGLSRDPALAAHF
jgi:hypothetical protein